MSDYFLDKHSEQELKARSGFVYRINAVGSNRYKIGITSNPKKRIESLRQQSPYPLRFTYIIHTLECKLVEQRIHKSLEKYRVHGEWFVLSDDDSCEQDAWMCLHDSVESMIANDAYNFLITHYKIAENRILCKLIRDTCCFTCHTCKVYKSRSFDAVIDSFDDLDEYITHYMKYPLLGYQQFWDMMKPYGMIGGFILNIGQEFGSEFLQNTKTTDLLIGWLYGKGWGNSYWWS